MADDGFKLVAELEPSHCPSTKVFKWIAPRSGLQVVLMQRQSPLVEGFCTLATEANDNSGCPHALERLVFMGSKQYPYKGVLDSLGKQQLSTTRSWTMQDHTCYVLKTAGLEAFANLLPVYLDHILNASIEDSACLTEIYHVNAKGEEGGTVFSEAQEFEHYNVTRDEAKRQLYAMGSGYSTDPEGKPDALRTLNWDTIREYYAANYHAANLLVTVCGNVLPEELMNILSPLEATLPDKTPFPRPFLESPLSNAPSPLRSTTTIEVEFPDSDETTGDVFVAWLGPPVTETVNMMALQAIASYLTLEGSGKLELKYIKVPNEQALALDVGASVLELLQGRIEVYFSRVPTAKLKDAGATLLHYLTHTLLQELDLDFLHQCIERAYDALITDAENDSDMLVDAAITDFVYGDRNGEFLKERFESTTSFEHLRTWTEEHWRSFITKWVVEPAKICVLGRPSKAFYKALQKDKRRRQEKLKRSINLDAAGRALQDSIAKNERPIPKHILNLFPVPDFSKIRFISSRSAATPKLTESLASHPLRIDETIQANLKGNVDLAINFESIQSRFVTIKVFISPQCVDRRLLPLIRVVLSNTFAMPMSLDNGEKLSAAEVAQIADHDLLDKSIGPSVQSPETVLLEVKAGAGNYAKATMWIKRAMFQIDVDETRCAFFIAQHLEALATDERTKWALLRSAANETLLNDDSLQKQSDSILTEAQIRGFAANISQTVADVKQLMQQLYRRENMRILVIADASKLEDPLAPWRPLDAKLPACSGLRSVPQSFTFLSSLGRMPAKKCVISLQEASSRSEITIMARGPCHYNDSDLAPLALVSAYLAKSEGPFWRANYAPGYAARTFLRTSVSQRQISLNICWAADALSVLAACRQAVEDMAFGRSKVNEKELSAGASLVAKELVAYLRHASSAATVKFLNTVIKGCEPDHAQALLRKVQQVTTDEFLAVLQRYLVPLFNPASSVVFMVVPTSKKDIVTEAMEQLRYEVEVRRVEIESASEEISEDNGRDEDSCESSCSGSELEALSD